MRQMRKSALFGLAAVVLVLGGIVGVIALNRSSSLSFSVMVKDANKLVVGDRVYHQGVVIGEVSSVGIHRSWVRIGVRIKKDVGVTPRRKDLFVVWEDRLITGKKCLLMFKRKKRGAPLKNGIKIRGYGARHKVIWHVGKLKGMELLSDAKAEGKGILSKLKKVVEGGGSEVERLIGEQFPQQ